jgi:drug/metabolite transporter (DMT)-like permease
MAGGAAIQPSGRSLSLRLAGAYTAGMTAPSSVADALVDRTAKIAFAALIAGALAIALSPIFVRVSELAPTATAFWRVALALPLLIAWQAGNTRWQRPATRRPPPTGLKAIGLLALPGVFFAGDLFFWHQAIAHTSVANSTLLANFAPIFVTLGSWLIFGERFTGLFIAGLALALVGAVALMGDSLAIGWDTLLGDAFGLITAMFYAAYILSVGRLRGLFGTLPLMVGSSAVTALCLLPMALIADDQIFAATWQGWAVLFGLAWITHAGGQGLIAYALAHLPAAFSSVGLLVQPVAAAVLAWVLLAEPLGPVQILGGLVVLMGIFVARIAARRDRPVKPAL